MWDWAISNVIEDQKETSTMVKNIFDGLKPWLNLELWKHNKPKKEDDEIEEISDTFIDELAKRGAGAEEINSIVNNTPPEKTKSNVTDITLVEG